MKKQKDRMYSKEHQPLIVAIAGQTSTGKTRLGEGVVRRLEHPATPDIRPLDACVFSVGDIFRLLTRHAHLVDDVAALQASVHETLSQTHIEREASGRIRLQYDGLLFEQTYHNGQNAARLTTLAPIVSEVNQFMRDRMTDNDSYDVVLVDGRERRNADILIRTSATDAARIAIRRIEQPHGCCVLSDSHILRDIQARDEHEQGLVRALWQEETNVIDIVRSRVTPESDAILEHQVTTLVRYGYSHRDVEDSFGTIYLRDS